MGNNVIQEGGGQIAVVPGPIGYVTYNNFDLQLVRIEEWQCKNRRDEAADVDYCLADVTVGVRCIFNPAATATAINPQSNQYPGDRAGPSLANAWQVIFQDRKRLTITLGNDVVLDAPQRAANRDPAGNVAAASDADNGPRVLEFRVLEWHGIKTAVVFIRFSCTVGGGPYSNPLAQNNIVLSNRWSPQAHVDENWFTTVVTKGRMKLRVDQLYLQTNPHPDIFRGSCLPPVVDGFKRKIDYVIATEDASELMWQVTDRQMATNIPANSPATTIEGSITTGFDSRIKEPLLFVPGPGLLLFPGLASQMKQLLSGALAVPKNQFVLRAWGPPGGSRDSLTTLLLNIMVDRFRGISFGAEGDPPVVSLYLTQLIHEVQVQLTGEILGTIRQQVGAALSPAKIADRMQVLSPINAAGVTLGNANNPVPNKNPPNAGGSRGHYVGILLATALKRDFSAPAANVPSYDSNVGRDAPFA
jgi:hypothetical protein